MSTDWEPLEDLSEKSTTSTPSSSRAASAPSAKQCNPRRCEDSERRITTDMVIRALERQHVKFPVSCNQAKQEKTLAKQTHLHLNSQQVSHIDGLLPLMGLEVLYLYENRISVIENLDHLQHLTHLYLQDNNIHELTGLAGLTSLQKLYLQGNCLQVVMGLEMLTSLEELHVSCQRLPQDSAGLQFDELSMRGISGSLRVLSATQCGLRDCALLPLAELAELRKLDISQNQVQGTDALEELMRGCQQLKALDLRGNHVCRTPKYRDAMILMSDSLISLDDEVILPKQREFLLRFQLQKMRAQLRAEQQELPTRAPGAEACQAPSHVNSIPSLPEAKHTKPNQGQHEQYQWRQQQHPRLPPHPRQQQQQRQQQLQAGNASAAAFNNVPGLCSGPAASHGAATHMQHSSAGRRPPSIPSKGMNVDVMLGMEACAVSRG